MAKAAQDRIEFDYTHFFADAVGAKNGITEKEWERASGPAEMAFEAVRAARRNGSLPFMDLHLKTAEAAEIEAYAKKMRRRFENFVVLGIGGSALGGIALQSALNPAFYNLPPAAGKKRPGPRIFFEDNVDPERVCDLLDRLDLDKTLFNVVSKSGTTAETMAAFLIVRQRLQKRFGAKGAAERIVATTDREKGVLRKIADDEGIVSFPVPDGVGGRFSVLSAVGLLPAAMAGIDIQSLLAGAKAMDLRCGGGKISANPALAGAALQWIADVKKGKTIAVMMPYSVALRDIADWFRQIWAESLGKRVDRKGKVVYAGQTPVKALGATDQHSQIQLYNEGPNNKTIVFIRVEEARKDIKIPKLYGDVPALACLGGQSLQDLLNAECAATEMAVTKYKRPNGRITLPRVSANAVGQLLYALEVQTAYAGELYGIDAFDQPGVEEGKISTYALMGRPGFEKRAAEIAAFSKGLKRRLF